MEYSVRLLRPFSYMSVQCIMGAGRLGARGL